VKDMIDPSRWRAVIFAKDGGFRALDIDFLLAIDSRYMEGGDDHLTHKW
jgi:hypothetical protein